MAYRGKFRPKNIEKYAGDHTAVTYRSLWERQMFKWCDDNPSVIKWNSEEVVVPYFCQTDLKSHRYFVDLYIKFKNGAEYLIEIKPEKETKVPKVPKRKTARWQKEVLTYVKNQAKWTSAEKYAKDRGMIFEVWTERTIKSLGVVLLT